MYLPTSSKAIWDTKWSLMVFVYVTGYQTVHHNLCISQTVCTMSGSAVASWLVNSTLGQVV